MSAWLGIFRRRSVQAGIAGVAIAAFGTVAYARAASSPVTYRTGKVTYGTITQSIAMSGNLAPATESDLDFPLSGVVASVNVVVGQVVDAGAVVATLDSSTQSGQLTQAIASLATAQARLSQDAGGPTPSALAQMTSSIAQDQVNVANAQTSFADTVAVNAQSLAAAQAQISDAQNLVNADSAVVSNDDSTLQQDQQKANSDCAAGSGSSQCQQDQQAVHSDQTRDASDRQTLARDQSSLDGARNSLASLTVKAQQSNDQARAQVATAQQQLAGAQAALAAAQQGATADQLQIDRSAVSSAQVGVDNAQRLVNQTSLVVPVSGTVLQVNITAGQNSGPLSASAAASATATHAIVIITPGALKVVGTVGDSQVNQVSAGQAAQITPSGSTEALLGTVTQVAASGTLTSGVASFQVTVELRDAPRSLRPGTSAAVNIILNRVVHVLTVPTTAVRGGAVETLVKGKPQSVQVQLGASDPFRTQVLGGLNEGDDVVIATISSAVPSTGAGTSFGGVGGGGRGGRGGGG